MNVCSYRTADERCVELTDSTYCERHRKQKRRQSDKRRPSARDRGYTTKWERFRTQYLRDHPFCEDPEGCGEPASDVDHLDGQGPNGARGYDEANLRPLCHSHHSKRTARDQPGGFIQ